MESAVAKREYEVERTSVLMCLAKWEIKPNKMVSRGEVFAECNIVPSDLQSLVVP